MAGPSGPLLCMKIKIIGNPITPVGSLSNGVVYDLDKALALHLVEIGCGQLIETKIEQPKKSTAVTNVSLSSQADRPLPKSKPRKRKGTTS